MNEYGNEISDSSALIVKSNINKVIYWTINDVEIWLKEINFEMYVEVFESHGINGRALVMLNEDDMKQLINNIGDRKNLFFHIRHLKSICAENGLLKISRQNSVNETNVDSIHKLSGYICEKCLKKFNKNYDDSANNLINVANNLKSEKLKTFVSVIYLFISSLWSTFMLTVVHDRVPDMQKYPPLPDIILDNVPLMSWAFYWAETIGLILITTLAVILYFHKFRWIIFRRLCSLGGTIFLLRSITMLITSLSVPGIHIQCDGQRYGSLMNKLKGAWDILTGAGLAVHGVRTCGDYMFSGHTVWLVLSTHFICEYTPYTMNWLHTGVWIMNLFGLFFILAAHEHYSIDVFIAFYIASRMFLYYHSLANNKVLFQRDNRRVKIWFPLFSYFEANIHTQIPNEYEDATPNMIKNLFKKINIFKKRKEINKNT